MTTQPNKFMAAAKQHEKREKAPLLKAPASTPTNPRQQMPQVRILGAAHPMEFAEDLNELVVKYKYASKQGKRLSQGELIELAFYQLRKQLTGQAIPNWVTSLKV